MPDQLVPVLEKVEPEFGSSFVMRSFSDPKNKLRPLWHYHPEIELVYIEEGSGKRHVGNHISQYNEGDLLLIGSNLPHFGFVPTLDDPHKEILIQIKESSIGEAFLNMIETTSMGSLFETAQLGISFHGNVKNEVGVLLNEMFEMSSFEKLMQLIKIFHILSETSEYNILNVMGTSLEVKGDDHLRIDKVYGYVRDNFSDKISVDQVSKEISMTVPAFCRFFKKTTNKTFVQFVNEYRVAHACELLSQQTQSIMDISFACGFVNLSNFNRAFKKITGKSPSEYRKEKTRMVN